MANSAEWKTFPLAATVDQRYADTSIDGLLSNGYLQKDANGTLWTRRRAGFTDLNLGSNGRGTGIIQELGLSFSTIVGYTSTSGPIQDTIYVNGVLKYTYTTSTGGYSWFNQTTVVTTENVYASNGLEGAFRVGPGTFSKITDPNYPATTINGSAYLNGYLYVLDQNGSIWGATNQNDFSTWSATNVINAWSTVGQAYAIRRYLNEIIVFKTFSLEVFYDAGNTVGSPLLPVQQVNIRWGCVDPNTIVTIDDEIFWVGNSDSGLKAVIKMNQFSPEVISTSAINRLVSQKESTISPPTSGLKGAFSASMGGNKFYCLSYVQNTNNVLSLIILAYNISVGEWSTFNTGLISNTTVSTTPVYPVASSQDSTDDIQQVLFSSGSVYTLDDSATIDSSTSAGLKLPISMKLRTDNFDAGTSVRKMVSGLRVRADQKLASTLQIRWSDNDYQTWSPWRTIDLSRAPAQLPGLQGTFTKRAYEIAYAGFDPIRISRLELLIALGDI